MVQAGSFSVCCKMGTLLESTECLTGYRSSSCLYVSGYSKIKSGVHIGWFPNILSISFHVLCYVQFTLWTWFCRFGSVDSAPVDLAEG